MPAFTRHNVGRGGVLKALGKQQQDRVHLNAISLGSRRLLLPLLRTPAAAQRLGFRLGDAPCLHKLGRRRHQPRHLALRGGAHIDDAPIDGAAAERRQLVKHGRPPVGGGEPRPRRGGAGPDSVRVVRDATHRDNTLFDNPLLRCGDREVFGRAAGRSL